MNRRRFALDALDLDEDVLAGAALGEPRRPDVGGEHVRVAVRARGGSAGSTGVNHAPVERLTTLRSNVVGDDRAGEAGASVVEHAHDVAVARCRARRRRRDGCGSASRPATFDAWL